MLVLMVFVGAPVHRFLTKNIFQLHITFIWHNKQTNDWFLVWISYAYAMQIAIRHTQQIQYYSTPTPTPTPTVRRNKCISSITKPIRLVGLSFHATELCTNCRCIVYIQKWLHITNIINCRTHWSFCLNMYTRCTAKCQTPSKENNSNSSSSSRKPSSAFVVSIIIVVNSPETMTATFGNLKM